MVEEIIPFKSIPQFVDNGNIEIRLCFFDYNIRRIRYQLFFVLGNFAYQPNLANWSSDSFPIFRRTRFLTFFPSR
jgi:hypothetical protein